MTNWSLRFTQGDEILGKLPERLAPLGGTRLAARCQRRGSDSTWLRGAVMIFGILDV